MVKIKRALISVSDKEGILDFAKELSKLGTEIISTGGTAKLLRENNIPVKEVSEYTNFPEILNGRVKTLHPKIHAGLLALRDSPGHMQSIKDYEIGLIDMVVVNLYPFEKTIQNPGVHLEEAIENIDIGGPSMLRSAAKNYKSVAVISSPNRYSKVITELKKNNGYLSLGLMVDLAIEAFDLTSQYDRTIYEYLKKQTRGRGQRVEGFPEELILEFTKLQDLRYGENPHQKAALYKSKESFDKLRILRRRTLSEVEAPGAKSKSLVEAKQLQGKELSFNNLLDLNSAWELVKEFKNPAAVIVKHNNPCGVAEDKSLDRAYLNAYKCDPLSAFGGIVALNRKIDLKVAKTIIKSGFLECIIAVGFEQEAQTLFKAKKNLRLLELNELGAVKEVDFKAVSGGLLLQDKDLEVLDEHELKIVTQKKPSKKEIQDLIFAWKVAKYVKSNAIVLTQGTRTVGIGAGQMSRVDAVMLAKLKARNLSKNSCLASDAFFPKVDAVREVSKAGVSAIIQPGGSISDEEIIKACDKYKIAMVFTGIRHFRH